MTSPAAELKPLFLSMTPPPPRDRLSQSAVRTCSVSHAPQQQEAAEQQRFPAQEQRRESRRVPEVPEVRRPPQQLPPALHALTGGPTSASMPLKKTVAAERRMDLASFFCMIGRHGPAVALAVVAVVTVLAGFYIYRTVTGRRRKAACGEEDGDGDGSVVRRGRCGSAGGPTGKRARRERCWGGGLQVGGASVERGSGEAAPGTRNET